MAPSGAVQEARLERGVRVLERWGLRVRLGESIRARRGYLAGDDDARLRDLQRMLDDPDVRAVFCARGGYGSQRLVPSLCLAALSAAPKPVVGYSDASALLAAIVGAGVVAVHGPMVAQDMARGLSARSEDHLRRLLADPGYVWEAELPEIVRPGRAVGRLVGGCLSVVAALAGTPWAPDTDGAILFLEDVHERPYRIDRLLTQLRQAGMLDRLAGLVFGTMMLCPVVDDVAPLDVIRACCADLPCPVAFGLPAGHQGDGPGIDHLALPLGLPVAMDTARGRLVALEGAVV
ncbi:MAG TPA: LD-carboxypeptidase [Dehalococcoidia bacterium]|nr:LD-carboxypeptidase [Dehalococcoidia bacterium]